MRLVRARLRTGSPESASARTGPDTRPAGRAGCIAWQAMQHRATGGIEKNTLAICAAMALSLVEGIFAAPCLPNPCAIPLHGFGVPLHLAVLTVPWQCLLSVGLLQTKACAPHTPLQRPHLALH
jgi:hypothetical protein